VPAGSSPSATGVLASMRPEDIVGGCGMVYCAHLRGFWLAMNLETSNYPQCGASLSVAMLGSYATCQFCGSTLTSASQRAAAHAAATCSCGRRASARCRDCPSWICDHHDLTLTQFALGGILPSSVVPLPHGRMDPCIRQLQVDDGFVPMEAVNVSRVRGTLRDRAELGTGFPEPDLPEG